MFSFQSVIGLPQHLSSFMKTSFLFPFSGHLISWNFLGLLSLLYGPLCSRVSTSFPYSSFVSTSLKETCPLCGEGYWFCFLLLPRKDLKVPCSWTPSRGDYRRYTGHFILYSGYRPQVPFSLFSSLVLCSSLSPSKPFRLHPLTSFWSSHPSSPKPVSTFTLGSISSSLRFINYPTTTLPQSLLLVLLIRFLPYSYTSLVCRGYPFLSLRSSVYCLTFSLVSFLLFRDYSMSSSASPSPTSCSLSQVSDVSYCRKSTPVHFHYSRTSSLLTPGS